MRARSLAVIASMIITLPASVSIAAEVCGDGLDNDSDGLEDEGCWPVRSVCEDPLSCATTGAVAPKMGSVVHELPPDFDPKVAYGPRITFQRTIVSHYRPGTGAGYRNPFGNLMVHNWLSWIDLDTTPNPDQASVHMPDGRDVLFKKGTTSGGYDYYDPQVGVNVDYLRQATTSPFKWELRRLTGEVYVYDWSSPTGKLIEVRDSLATPNIVTVSYDGSGRVQYVTDAQGTKRLKLNYNASSRLTKVEYQTIASGVATTRSYADYGYNNNQVQNYQPNSSIAQAYSYTSGEMTLIEDDAGNDILSYTYMTGSNPKKVARLKASYGELGFEYASARTSCSGGTVEYFNRQGTTACDTDSDCGTGLLCGGQTDMAGVNTGGCYRAARCLQLSSPSEDLVTTVTPVAPSGDTCTGQCTDTAEYAWNTSSVLDLKAVKDPAANWTSYSYNADGLPTTIVYGDNDNDASNGGGARTLFLFYGNSSYPGRLTESRHQSDLSTGTCSASVTTGCQRRIMTYNSDGQLSSVEEDGFTLNASNTVTAYAYTTSYTHDSHGRLTQIDGPLSGANDITDLTYWSSTDVYKDGQPKEIKRKKNSTDYLVTTLDDYDYWGNAKSVQDPDSTFTCFTFEANRNYITSVREAMNGQASCATTHSSDLIANYTRNKALLMTKVEYPAGGCKHYEYDASSRLVRIKARDDCNAASAGEKKEYTYDDDGLLIKTEVFDASGNVTRRQEQTYYDSRRLATRKNPVNTSVSSTRTYNSRGFLETVEAESSLSKTEYLYDNDDRLETLKRYTGVSTFDSWDLVHDWFATLTDILDDDSKAIEDTHDDMGRKVRSVTPDSGTDLRVYNANGTVATKVDAYGRTGVQTHSYTSDNLRRTLTIDYSGSCGAGAPVEVSSSFDTLPTGISCPTGVGCNRTAGRLAYVKTTLLCSASYGDNALDQETFYSYDDAGRMIREYIRDDSGRTADHTYAWTKNGALSQVTTPSGAVMGWTFGTAGGNSDQAMIAAAWRTSTSTPIVDNVAWFPFGPLKSYRQQNTISGNQLQTVISRNLAYRISNIRVEQTTGTLVFQAAISEDDKGRVTSRVFSGGHANLQNSYFQYDKLDRVTCESTSSGCAGTKKNQHDASPPFTASNDWKNFQRPIPGKSDTDHAVTLVTGRDQLAGVDQTGAFFPSYGLTEYFFDDRGNRTSDDNRETLTQDARTYTFDGGRNLKTASGKYYTGSAWHVYTVTSAYDANHRRVFKSFKDVDSGAEAQWFFYYDALDRLTEIRHTPDISASTTYDVYQIAWVDSRAVAFWVTSYPATTTSKRYVHTDETTRPLEMYYWPSSGDATRAWAINADAYGNDKVLTGSTLLQPFVFPGQYRDSETIAWVNDGVTQHRSSLVLNWFRDYDPFIGAYLQTDPEVPTTWDVYVYASNDPVSKADPTGRLYQECTYEAPVTCDEPTPTSGHSEGCWTLLYCLNYDDDYGGLPDDDDGPGNDGPDDPGGPGGDDGPDDPPPPPPETQPQHKGYCGCIYDCYWAWQDAGLQCNTQSIWDWDLPNKKVEQIWESCHALADAHNESCRAKCSNYDMQDCMCDGSAVASF